MFARMLWAAAAAVGMLVAGSGAALAEKRVALVIGNATYAKVEPLANTLNDAGDVSAALVRLGFKVTRVDNASFDAMRKGLRDFSRVAAGSDMALVYYAGHGMEMGGENYLIPVDAELARDTDMEHEAVTLKSVMATVEGAKRLGLVVLDACRNNPFAARVQRSGGASRSIGRGLARVEPTGSVLVAFAAKEGTTAGDGEGRNSPFTASLLKHLETPDLEINFLFRNVRDDVVTATARVQEPFVYGSLSREAIFLKKAEPILAALPSTPSPQPLRIPTTPAAPLFTGDPGLACDQAAAYRHDTRRPANVNPVANGKIDGPRAIAACLAATRAFPNEPRYEFQLGRGYFAVGNNDQTIEYLTRAAKRNYGAAACAVGQVLQGGRITRGHSEFAVRWFEIGLGLGEYECANNLGLAHVNGRGVAVNQTRAAAFFRIAAARGHEDAQVSLGYMLVNGIGIARDTATARTLYDAAIAAGNAQAMNNQALLLRQIAPAELGRSADLMLAAYKAGNANARVNLVEKFNEAFDRDFRRAIEERLAKSRLLNRQPTGAFDTQTMEALQRLLTA